MTMLKTADLAAQYNVTQETVRRWIQKGQIEAVQPGGVNGHYRVVRPDVVGAA